MILIDRIRKDGWCHMICPQIDQLHRFAKRIGVTRSNFHYSKYGQIPQYDLRRHQIERALEHGAIQVSSKVLVEYYRTADDQIVFDLLEGEELSRAKLWKILDYFTPLETLGNPQMDFWNVDLVGDDDRVTNMPPPFRWRSRLAFDWKPVDPQPWDSAEKLKSLQAIINSRVFLKKKMSEVRVIEEAGSVPEWKSLPAPPEGAEFGTHIVMGHDPYEDTPGKNNTSFVILQERNRERDPEKASLEVTLSNGVVVTMTHDPRMDEC